MEGGGVGIGLSEGSSWSFGPWNDGRGETQGRRTFDVRLMFEGQVRSPSCSGSKVM